MERRKILTRIVQGFSFTGLAFIVYPFVKAWRPSFVEDLSLTVNISDLGPGDVKQVHWLGRNILVVRRKKETIQALGQTLKINLHHLKDPHSQYSTQPEFAQNSFRSERPDLFVTYTNCTHLGCEVMLNAEGFRCPCHQSNYDAAGRVHIEAAAPKNLTIPTYRYVSQNAILLQSLES